MKRIIDFIESWMYYPEMKKFLKDVVGNCYWTETRFARLKYSWWHCRAGELKRNRR